MFEGRCVAIQPIPGEVPPSVDPPIPIPDFEPPLPVIRPPVEPPYPPYPIYPAMETEQKKKATEWLIKG